MMHSLLHKVGFKESIVGDDMQTQASSTELMDTSVLTSTTAEAKTVLPELIPLFRIKYCERCAHVVSFCIVCLQQRHQRYCGRCHHEQGGKPLQLHHGYRHGGGGQEIVHEDGNNALEPDVIADMAEDAVDEAIEQSGVKNDNRHAAGEEIVAITYGRAGIVYHHP
jgi:hypothetical protein